MQAVAAAGVDTGGAVAPGGSQGLGQGFDVGQQQGLGQGLGQAFDGRGALGGMFGAGQQGGSLAGPPPQTVGPPPSPPGRVLGRDTPGPAGSTASTAASTARTGLAGAPSSSATDSSGRAATSRTTCR